MSQVIVIFYDNVNMGPILNKLEKYLDVPDMTYYTFNSAQDYLNDGKYIREKQKIISGNDQIKMWKNSDSGLEHMYF